MSLTFAQHSGGCGFNLHCNPAISPIKFVSTFQHCGCIATGRMGPLEAALEALWLWDWAAHLLPVRAPGHLEALPGRGPIDSTAAQWPMAAAPSFCSRLITMQNGWWFMINLDSPTFLRQLAPTGKELHTASRPKATTKMIYFLDILPGSTLLFFQSWVRKQNHHVSFAEHIT